MIRKRHTTMASATEQRIIKLAQELLLEEAETEPVTPTLINGIIDRVVSLYPSWQDGINRDSVTDELIRRFSLWIGRDTTLHNNEGHKEWLTQGLKRDWRYWQRYREWLERKLSYKAVDALDRSTDSVLALLENPLRDGGWDRRGLVVGHVQSGKTSHYSGLICKAADAGYKIIIVLAGLHNNLRAQTQLRLDEAFLGYRTSAIDGDALLPIGVGEIDSDQSIRPNYATNRTEQGRFQYSHCPQSRDHAGTAPMALRRQEEQDGADAPARLDPQSRCRRDGQGDRSPCRDAPAASPY